MFKATVYDAEGKVVPRLFKGKPVPGHFLEFERETAHRAWLSARTLPDKPGGWPAGITIKVTHQEKPVPGTDLQAPEELVHERKWDGKKWTEVATGEPVA